jgi:hypothetical protein
MLQKVVRTSGQEQYEWPGWDPRRAPRQDLPELQLVTIQSVQRRRSIFFEHLAGLVVRQPGQALVQGMATFLASGFGPGS